MANYQDVFLSEDMESQLEKILSLYQGKRQEVIPLLQEVQEQLGYLPEEVMVKIAKFCKVPTSSIFGIASFYAQFRFKPQGRKRITICRGTACHVSGASQILDEIERQLGIKEGETTSDMEYSLETVACIGCCALAPCAVIDDNVHANLTAGKIPGILNEVRSESK